MGKYISDEFWLGLLKKTSYSLLGWGLDQPVTQMLTLLPYLQQIWSTQ